jgi:hypothetical protein
MHVAKGKNIPLFLILHVADHPAIPFLKSDFGIEVLARINCKRVSKIQRYYLEV